MQYHNTSSRWRDTTVFCPAFLQYHVLVVPQLSFSALLAKFCGNKGIQYHSQEKKLKSSNTQNNVPRFKRFLKLGLLNQLRAGVWRNQRRIKYDALIHNRFALYASQQWKSLEKCSSRECVEPETWLSQSDLMWHEKCISMISLFWKSA